MEFKPKDWVRVTDSDGELGVAQYIEGMENSPIFIKLEPWQPQEREWVIIKPKHPHINKETSFHVTQYSKTKCKAYDVEPYLGELPSFIED